MPKSVAPDLLWSNWRRWKRWVEAAAGCVVAVAVAVAVAVVAPEQEQEQEQVGEVRARLPACVHSVAPARPNDWAFPACRLLFDTRTRRVLRISNMVAVHRT
jgi:hypothetical protein